MLSLLHIENLAVVEKAEITFLPGFNVLTGETGAGKSIVLGAIGAILGDRVSRDLVRTDAPFATITAVFTQVAKLDWFDEHEVSYDPDELIIMRKITADGKGSARVNGLPITAGQLKALGDKLLHIHGQHDGQALLHEQHHLDFLDNFGDYQAELLQYKETYTAHRNLQQAFNALQMDEGEKLRRLENLEGQIAELEAANLRIGEEEELKERRNFLVNGEKLSNAVNSAFAALYGGEDIGEGALSLLEEADSHITYAGGLSESFAPISQSLSDLRYGVEDILEHLREMRNSLTFSPDELDELENRLTLIGGLSRKYGRTVEDMLLFLQQAKEELDTLTFSADHAVKLERELTESTKALSKAGLALRKARMTASKNLEEQVVSQLQDLSMPGVRFSVSFVEQAADKTGMDNVSFLMSANAGEKMGKIAKIASGGELARIMLALKSVLSAKESVLSMVFDEVDTGVSGIAAQRVGEKMSNIAREKQVICVTHLPQIAALADTHYHILKSLKDQRTYTQVTQLSNEGRKREIARLTGGDNITETSLKAADEQLLAAEKYKQSRV